MRVTHKAIREVLTALDRIRVQRDLSYDELAVQVGISRRSLFRLANDPTAGVRDRTVHKIKVYLLRADAEAEATNGSGAGQAVAS